MVFVCHKESFVFYVPEQSFEDVKKAITRFCLLWREPSQARQIEFMESLGFKKNPIKLGQNNGKIVFGCIEENASLDHL